LTSRRRGIRNLKDVPNRIDGARQLMKDAGAEMKSLHLTMGAYDLVVVVEAPNDEVAAKVLLAIGARGNVRTVTLKAFDEAQTLNLLRSVA
jgi:uncharacterized protein with GYD domain